MERREKLLDAAQELFLAQGYDGTSLDEVIEVAGGSKRAIYRHFDGKKGLFAAALERLFDESLAPLADMEVDADPPEEALVEAGCALVEALTSPTMVAAFRVVIGRVDEFPELAESLFERGPQTAYDKVATYLRARDRQGRLAVDAPDVAARQLVEMIKGELHLRALLGAGDPPDSEETERHVRRAVRLFLRGIDAKP